MVPTCKSRHGTANSAIRTAARDMYEALSVARSSTDLAARGSQHHPTMANSKIEDVMRISANLLIISPEREFPGRFNFRSGYVPTAFVGAGTFNWYIHLQAAEV